MEMALLLGSVSVCRSPPPGRICAGSLDSRDLRDLVQSSSDFVDRVTGM